MLKQRISLVSCFPTQPSVACFPSQSLFNFLDLLYLKLYPLIQKAAKNEQKFFSITIRLPTLPTLLSLHSWITLANRFFRHASESDHQTLMPASLSKSFNWLLSPSHLVNSLILILIHLLSRSSLTPSNSLFPARTRPKWKGMSRLFV